MGTFTSNATEVIADCHSFLIRIPPWKAEQLLQGMELQEKEGKKD